MDFSPAAISTLVLLSGRVGGLVLVAPVFSSARVPTMVRVGVSVLLTLLLQSAARSSGSVAPELTPATYLGEMVIGFAIGLGAALIIGGAQVAGDLMGMQIGLSGASVFDPISATTQNVLGQFGALFATALLLAVNGHLVMIDAIARSLRVVPIGTEIHPAGLLSMVRGGSTLFVLGLQFAAPAIGAVLVSSTALAILTRAAPQLNILSIAFPIHIGLGLFALAVTVPVIGAFYSAWQGSYDGMLTRFLAPLAHGGGY